MVRRIGWLVLSLIFFCGVALLAERRSSGPPAPPIPLATLNQGEPVSDEEAIAFGAEFGEAMASGEEAKLTRHFDLPALIKLSMNGINVPPADMSLITERFRTGLWHSLSKPYARGENGRASWITPVRVLREEEGECWLLLRIVTPDRNLQHIKVALARRRGQIRVVDVYTFLLGERMSRMMRSLMIQAVVRKDQGALGSLSLQDREFIEHVEDLGALSKAKREGRWRDGMDICRRLPESIRSSKIGFFYRITFAQELMEQDEAGFLKVVEDFRARYPDDPGINVIAIDACLIRKQYEEAIACVDRLDGSLGGDPYLDVMRADIKLLSGKIGSAKECATRAAEALAGCPDPLCSLVEISLAERSFGDTLALLRKLRDEFGVGFPNMATSKRFAEFVKSPEYREWTKE